jgi:methionine-gamma-lyase
MSSKKTSKEPKKKLLPNVEQAARRTQLIHGKSSTQSWEFSKHLIPPVTSTTTFRLESLKRGAQGFIDFGADTPKDDAPILIYDRLNEPNTMMIEEQLALMEGADCAVSFGSGMGAISTTLLSVLKAGQSVVAHRTLYGCTYSLLTGWLPRLGIETKMVDINSAKDRKVALTDDVRVVYFETVSNPSLDLADLPAIVADIKKINAKRKKEDRIITIVDNTFATPWGLRPLEWGIDIVVHSLTKNISGFGTDMGGAAMCSREFEKGLKIARKDFGAIMTPRTAWNITVHGIPTLALRYNQQQENAKKVALFLEGHKKVERVIYPGLKSHPQYNLAKKLLKTPEGQFAPGTMISFIVKGDMGRCEKFVDWIATNSYSITLAVSLGVTKTLIEVPGFMTHSAIPADQQSSSGIHSRGIRLSLGIENADDLIKDLASGLAQI